MKFFRPRIERFEARRLMANDLVSSPGLQVDSTTFMVSTLDVAEQVTPAEDSQFVVANPIIDYASDSVVARSGSRTVIASRAYGGVVIVDESNLVAPQVVSRLRMEIGIQDVRVDGQRAIVFGQASYDHTEVIAIDLVGGKVVNRVSLGPGQFSFAHLRGDDAWVVWNGALNPAVSPAEEIKLIHFQWGEAGLVEKDSLAVPRGLWSVADNRLIMESTRWIGGVTYDTTINLYDISDSQLSQLATLELKNSFSKSVFIASDGQSATLIRGVGDPLVDPQTSVDLLDLSSGSIRIGQSIIVNDATEVYRHDGDMAVLYGQYKRQLVLVDLKSGTSDQARLHSWDLPWEASTNMGVLSLSDGRLGVPAFVFHNGPFFSETTSPSDQLTDGNYLLVLDPATNQQQMVRVELSGSRFFSLEPGSNRIGIWGASGNFSTFVYGELDDQLKFVKEGEITGTVDRYRDVPVVSANRLLTAYSDQIAIYDLENAGKNLLVASVSGVVGELKAPNHDLRVSKAGMLLQPFDPFDFRSPSSTRIHLIALEGAPTGIQITDPHTISFPAYTEDDKQPIDFDYVISNGLTQARGHIHIVFTEEPFIMPPMGASSLRYNTTKPLDVNEDGIVTPIDVLLVINAINDGVTSAAVGAIDTNGDGVLQALDVLLVVNYLNRDIAIASSAVAGEADLDAIRTIVLREELARAFPSGAPASEQLLVGFEPPAEMPEMVTAVYLSYPEIVNQLIQKLEVPSAAFLSQPGLSEYNLGSPRLAIWKDGPLQIVSTDQPAQLIRVGRPKIEGELIHVEILRGYGPPSGAIAFEYLLQKVDGQWQVVSRIPTYIS